MTRGNASADLRGMDFPIASGDLGPVKTRSMAGDNTERTVPHPGTGQVGVHTPLRILFRNTDFVAVDKPAGCFVHRSSLDPQASPLVLQLLRDQLNCAVWPCHRLDRPTSGVLLFALNKNALRSAQEAFAAGQIKKTYRAVIRGWIEAEGCVDAPLRREDGGRGPQAARTLYRRVAQAELPTPVGRYLSARLSLVELRPATGRRHQLRRHMAHIRHPILGDTRHGDGAQNRLLRELCRSQQLMLRAVSLALPGLRGQPPVRIEAPGGGPFERALKRLQLARAGST
jgi:tRNA pseudouridine65 synthase